MHVSLIQLFYWKVNITRKGKSLTTLLNRKIHFYIPYSQTQTLK